MNGGLLGFIFTSCKMAAILGAPLENKYLTVQGCVRVVCRPLVYLRRAITGMPGEVGISLVMGCERVTDIHGRDSAPIFSSRFA